LSFATTLTLEPPHGLTFASLLLHGYLLWDIFYRQLTRCFPHANDGLVEEFDGMLVWCFSESFAWSWSMSTMIMSLGGRCSLSWRSSSKPLSCPFFSLAWCAGPASISMVSEVVAREVCYF
jgi:hypothetical protein